MPTYALLADAAAEMGQVPPDSILSKAIEGVSGSRTVLFGFAPGQELSEHTSAKHAQLFFVRGHATITLGEDIHTVGPGAWVDMPPHLPHSIRAGDEQVVMLLVMLN